MSSDTLHTIQAADTTVVADTTAAAETASQQAPFDPPVQRTAVRITNLYGTCWEPVEHLDTTGPLAAYLRFGRLADYYNLAAEQLPAVGVREILDPATLTFDRYPQAGRVTAARVWVMVMPSGQSVVALTLDIEDALSSMIGLLEDCYYGDLAVDGHNWHAYVKQLAERLGINGADHGLSPERHQLVFSRQLPADNNREDLIQKLIYRADLPHRREFSSIVYPAELNRRPNASVAVGPYVSVICGQQDYVENAAFVSAAQALASAVRLREVRELAYEDVRLFREAQAAAPSLHTRRHTLERMANQLGNLELELSFSVESTADLGLLVPSLRVASFHDALFECIGLRDKAIIVGQMLQRLERSINAELTAIESVERRADETRRMRWTVAIGFLSTVALPITLVLTYFGINAREVNGDLSMFASHYLPIYIAVAVLVTTGITLSGGLYLQQRRQAARDAAAAAKAMTAVRSMALVRRRPTRPAPAELSPARPAASSRLLAPGRDATT